MAEHRTACPKSNSVRVAQLESDLVGIAGFAHLYHRTEAQC